MHMRVICVKYQEMFSLIKSYLGFEKKIVFLKLIVYTNHQATRASVRIN